MGVSTASWSSPASWMRNAMNGNVKSSGVRFENRAGDCGVDFVTLSREVQWCLCCRGGAGARSSFGVEEDSESWGLGLSELARFSRRLELDATVRWRCGWRSRFTARCGSAGSVGAEPGMKRPAAVLDAYLVRELLPPLVLGTAAFTILGVSIGVGPEVMALVEKLGFSFRHCLLYAQIVFLRLPSYIGLALPMASLLASMLAFGRLGVDSEVIALRAAGIGNLRMLRPTFVLFMGVTALHLLLAEGLTPRANQIAMEAADIATASVSTVRDFGKAEKRRTSSAAFSQPVIYPEYRKHRLAHLLYAQGFNGLNSLLTVTFVQMEEVQDQAITVGGPRFKLNGALPVRRVVLAEEAIWDEVQGLWIFNNGCEYVLGRKETLHNNGSSLQGVRRFSSQYISELTRAPLDFAKLGVVKSFEDMTILEASSLLGLMKASRNVKESRKLQVGLALTLVIVFGYYSLSVFGSLIGQLGYVSPILGAWLPNLAGALFAIALLFSTS